MATPRDANFFVAPACRLNPTNNYPNGCAKSQYFSSLRQRWRDGLSALVETGQGL
jgi:hypothetical protein